MYSSTNGSSKDPAMGTVSFATVVELAENSREILDERKPVISALVEDRSLFNQFALFR